MVSVTWTGDMVFESIGPSGLGITFDTYNETPGAAKGPTPVEALMGSIAACSAMDVISILEKKRQVVTGYRIEVEGVRAPEGEWPRPFLSLVIRHIVTGKDLDAAAVERSVELSDAKYCSVIATLRSSPAICSEWRIEEAKD